MAMQRVAPKSSSCAPQSSVRPNSVNLRAQALGAFLDKLDEPERAGGADKRRGFLRWPFRREALEVVLNHPGGTDVVIKAACRNLSCGGISVLHNSFVHPGSQCVVRLPKPNGSIVSVSGVVKRCIHRAGVVHEVGIAFGAAISARDFVAEDPFSISYALEKVNPAELTGSALIADPSQTGRGIMRHYLRETGLVMEDVASAAAAPALATGRDVVIAATELPDASIADFAQSIRSAGFAGALIVIAPDTSVVTRLRVLAAKPTIVLAQPLSQVHVLRALAEVLIVGRGRADSSGSNLDRAKADLAHASDELRTAAVSGSCIHCSRSLRHIGDIADASGWPAISKLARKLTTELQASNAVEPLAPAIQSLVQACVIQAA